MTESRGSRRGRSSTTRWPALVLVPALLVAMWLIDDDDEAATVEAEPDALVLGPLVASDDALGAFWFCAGGTGVANGLADHSIVVINTTDEERFATITVYGSRPEGGERPLPEQIVTTIAPYARQSLRLGDRMATDYVSATVELDGGGVLVEHSVGPPTAIADRAPCASSASANWSVPVGATDITAASASARELLVFFNPFPADAVVDVQFSTDEGERAPDEFTGFVVPGRSVVGVDLAGAKVTVSSEVAAEVVARTGRVVVDRIQIYQPDPEQPRLGVALSSGVAEPAEAWAFPAGGLSAVRHEQLVVYNAGDAVADVDVEVRPAGPVEAASEPFELTVQPHRHVLLDLSGEERMQTLLTDATPYSLVVRSADGTRISAERLIWVAPGQPGAGVATSTGSALAGLRLVADMAGAQPGSSLVLMNPSTETIARVRLSIIESVTDPTTSAVTSRLRDPVGPETVDLEPGQSRSIAIEDLGTGEITVLVDSNVPIIGERDVVIAGERFTAVAVPDASSASLALFSLFDDIGG
jgi:hypothetical protein